MEENKQRKNEQQMGEQNPTLNAPGSKVADYGNVDGGSGNEEVEVKRKTDHADRTGIEPLKGGGETVGNP